MISPYSFRKSFQNLFWEFGDTSRIQYAIFIFELSAWYLIATVRTPKIFFTLVFKLLKVENLFSIVSFSVWEHSFGTKQWNRFFITRPIKNSILQLLLRWRWCGIHWYLWHFWVNFVLQFIVISCRIVMLFWGTPVARLQSLVDRHFLVKYMSTVISIIRISSHFQRLEPGLCSFADNLGILA